MASALLTRRSVLQTAAVATTALACTLCARYSRGGKAQMRFLGPLGTRCQRAAGETVP